MYGAVGVPFAGDPLARSVSEGLSAGRLSYTRDDSSGDWQLRLTGKHTVDLTWRPFTPVVDFHDSFPGDDEQSQQHFEQAGRVTGSVTIDGVRRDIDGLGERDKSWGVRDWNGLIGWDWIAAQFGEDLAFNATRTDLNGELVSTGFVYADGDVQQVTDVQVTYTCITAHQPEAANIVVTVDSGRRFTIRAKARGRVPLLKSGLFIEETPSIFTLEHGGRTREGVGVVEHAYHVGTIDTLRRLPRLLPILRMARRMAR